LDAKTPLYTGATRVRQHIVAAVVKRIDGVAQRLQLLRVAIVGLEHTQVRVWPTLRHSWRDILLCVSNRRRAPRVASTAALSRRLPPMLLADTFKAVDVVVDNDGVDARWTSTTTMSTTPTTTKAEVTATTVPPRLTLMTMKSLPELRDSVDSIRRENCFFKRVHASTMSVVDLKAALEKALSTLCFIQKLLLKIFKKDQQKLFSIICKSQEKKKFFFFFFFFLLTRHRFLLEIHFLMI
jgi:hypothetical protein